MKTRLFFFFLISSTFLSCKQQKHQQPDWVIELPKSLKDQLVIDNKGDSLLITQLINFNRYQLDIDSILASDSVHLISSGDWNYQESENKFDLVFDSITYIYDSTTGSLCDSLNNYFPNTDLAKYPQSDCWVNSNALKLATIGSTCSITLSNDYKKNKIVLKYYTKHFKEESCPIKMGFSIYQGKRETKEVEISDYKNINNSFIIYFSLADAVYFIHYNPDDQINYMSKFSFEKIIQ